MINYAPRIWTLSTPSSNFITNISAYLRLGVLSLPYEAHLPDSWISQPSAYMPTPKPAFLESSNIYRAVSLFWNLSNFWLGYNPIFRNFIEVMSCCSLGTDDTNYRPSSDSRFVACPHWFLIAYIALVISTLRNQFYASINQLLDVEPSDGGSKIDNFLCNEQTKNYSTWYPCSLNSWGQSQT